MPKQKKQVGRRLPSLHFGWPTTSPHAPAKTLAAMVADKYAVDLEIIGDG